MEKLAFIVSFYEKIDDTLVQLEILDQLKIDHEVIITYMRDDIPSEKFNELEKYHPIRIPCYGHFVGPPLSLIRGMKKAYELGCNIICYRNGDDWMFNHELTTDNYYRMIENQDIWVQGYNWLTVGTFFDLTFNELFFRVDKFINLLNQAEDYFLYSNKYWLCEFKLGKWVRNNLKNLDKNFHRLEGREQLPGIGHTREDVPNVFKTRGETMPVGFWELLENNNRFFNFQWKLIGSHNNQERFIYWNKIEPYVEYVEELYKRKNFKLWLNSVKNKTKWNMDKLEKEEKIPAKNIEKSYGKKRKIFIEKE